MTRRAGPAISLAMAIGLSACGNSPPAEGDPPTAAAPAPAAAPSDAAAPRNAGVLTMTPSDGGVHGGLVGSDPGTIPGLPAPPPRGPCEDAIAEVRRLLCRAKIERGDIPLMDDVRDVVIASCADLSTTAAARGCVARAVAASDLRTCPRAARAAAPGDCETIRLQTVKLAILDEACANDPSPMGVERDDFLVANVARWVVRRDEWIRTCAKTRIPPRALACVLKASTTAELARCGL